jgi:sugar lactone lactonase YvrE
MKTYHLKSTGFAAALALIASWGRAQIPGSNDEADHTGIVSAALDGGKTGIQIAGSPVQATANYRWESYFVDDQPKPGLAGVAVDAAGSVYVIKGGAILRIATDRKMSIVAGSAGDAGSEDGVGSAARFNAPDGLAIDGSSNLFVSDRKNHTIRKITAAGVVTTLAGSPGIKGSADGAAAARFYHPGGISLDAIGNLFVAEMCNDTIRRVTPDGIVSTVAGRAAPGQIRLCNSAAAVGMPAALAVDGGGNIYYVQRMGRVIRKLTPDGAITTVGGVEEQVSEAVDGPGGIARFQKPTGLAVDAQGDVYVTDNGAIRKMTPDGTVSTIGGKSAAQGGEDASSRIARSGNALAVAVSGTGVLYVTRRDGVIQGTPVR